MQQCTVATMQRCSNATMHKEYEQKTNECTFGALCTVATMQLCNNATMQQSTDATMHKRICCKKPMNALPTHYASLQQYNRASTECTFGALCTLAPKRNKRLLFLRLYIKIIKNNPCTFGAFCTVATMQLCNNAVMRQCANEHEQKTSRCTFGAICTLATMQVCNNATMHKEQDANNQ